MTSEGQVRPDNRGAAEKLGFMLEMAKPDHRSIISRALSKQRSKSSVG